MQELRLRGEEVAVRFSLNGVLQNNITAVKDFSFIVRIKLLEEGYLAEKTLRKDNIFEGVKGSITIDPEHQDYLKMMAAVRDGATRTTPLVINAIARLSFPNGQRPRILVPNLIVSGDLPLNASGRDSYVRGQFPYEAADFDLLLS